MKHIIRRILKEQDEVINAPDLFDFFDGDWEELLRFTKGRKFRVRHDLQLREICPKTLGNMVSVDGYLSLYNCKNLTSLGSLEYVTKGLDLIGCNNLTSLGSLERVGDELHLMGCKNLTSLGNLKYVGGNLNLVNMPIGEMYSEEQIRKMVEVKGKVHTDSVKYLLSILK